MGRETGPELRNRKRGSALAVLRPWLILLALAWPSAVYGEPAAASPGWPHLRGPRFDGTSPEQGLADHWPAEGPLVLWSTDVGQGYSAFCAQGGRVFTQTQTLYGQYLVCLDGDSGKRLWEHWYDWPYEGGGMYPGPRATPTWHDDRIYFAGPRGDVHCLRADDGERVWTVKLYERFLTQPMGFGYACSPLVEEGKVILPLGGPNSSLVALSPSDGSTVWAAGDEPASYCSALPITFQCRRYMVAFLQNSLASFDAETGRRVWQHKYSQGYDEHAAFPLYAEPHLLIASPFQSGSTLYRLEADGADADGSPNVSATLVRESRLLSNDTASSVLVDGNVYGFDLKDVQAKAHRPSRGQFRCLNLLSGDVQWSADEPGHATVLAADGKLILFNDRGELLLARATPERFDLLARTQVFSGEICWTPPALDRGRLYLRSPSRAVCLLLGQPERLSPVQRESARPTSAMPQPRSWDLSWLIGGERLYPFDPPTRLELKLWYVYSLLGVFVPAGLAALATYGWLRLRRSARAAAMSRAAFLAVSMVMGVAGMPLFNRLEQEFVFTWPASLFTVFQMTLWVAIWARRQPDIKRARRRARLAGLAFLLAGFVYFQLCWKLGMAIEWLFLIGLPLSSPVAVLAAFRLARRTGPLGDLFWTAASFSLYYLTCTLFVLWRMSPGTQPLV